MIIVAFLWQRYDLWHIFFQKHIWLLRLDCYFNSNYEHARNARVYHESNDTSRWSSDPLASTKHTFEFSKNKYILNK